MGILARVVQLCKADIHGVMDQLEDKELLLKQCLREMQEALVDKQNRLQALAASQKQIQEDLGTQRRKIDDLEKDLELAIEHQKDDISRMLIRKINPLEAHVENLKQHGDFIAKEMAGLAQVLDEQRRQYEDLKLQALKHMSAQTHTRAGTPSQSECAFYGTPLEDEEIELALMLRKEKYAAARKGGER